MKTNTFCSLLIGICLILGSWSKGVAQQCLTISGPSNRYIDLGVPYTDTITVQEGSCINGDFLDYYSYGIFYAIPLSNDQSGSTGCCQYIISGTPTQTGTFLVSVSGDEELIVNCPCPQNGDIWTNSFGFYLYSITVAVNNPILSATNISLPSACGQADGSIALATSGGHPPFSYSWNTGQNTASISNLNTGFYTVIVSDIYDLKDTLDFVLSNPTGPTLSSTSQTATCGFSNANGSAQVIVNSGTAPYSYSWENGINGDMASGLLAGTYNGLVWDSLGCATSFSIAVPTTPLVTASSAIIPILCANNLNSGSIDLMVNTGTAPFTYAWSNGDITQDLTGLSSGTYTVNITDSIGCMLIKTNVVSSNTLIVNISAGQNGSATATASGGLAPYSYSWDNGMVGATVTGLTHGTHTCEITDANGCTSIDSIIISSFGTAIQENCTLVQNIQVYPNPHHASFNIRTNFLYPQILHYTLFNSIGQQVWTKDEKTLAGENHFSISTEPLPQGIYTLEVRSEKGEKAYLKVISE